MCTSSPDSGVLPGLGYLIHHAPPTLRIILCGRRVPGLHLARMRVAGDLAEVDAADLACTPEEADAYFAKLGLAADPAERDDLLRRTQGWMAGLRLAALRANRDGTVNVGGISGDPLLADYMRDEVLDRQPAQIQLFLRRTSVAERLTGEYADWLTREPGGARILDQLDRENSFVARDESGQYRYHPCLREVLLAELRRTPEEVPVLFGRAARWHAARGDVVEAMRCAAEAGDWDQASLALAEAGIAGVLPRPDGRPRGGPEAVSRPSAAPAIPWWPPRSPRPGCAAAILIRRPRTAATRQKRSLTAPSPPGRSSSCGSRRCA